eukprot:CAMPEP_0113561832 /NCGR_PEP_ID=MMETSP0015_2-20120614/20193_1 /TAXON_ID=2838 /ORGANISM="Odontella" /LENGTH=449 /DNA_ID=CAMNT_0000463667 /DNA_START=91 /DNA_END=1437 /DNA_ORIENTATION=+ /assembly_acc=CAM_ASM_000160
MSSRKHDGPPIMGDKPRTYSRSHLFGSHPVRAGRMIEEEQPMMRSVAVIGAPSSAARALCPPPSLGRAAPNSTGLPPSLKRNGLGGILKKSDGPQLSKAPVGLGHSQLKSKGRRESYRTWKVSSVESLPDDFPLERTSRHIPDADAPVVSARISDCLRDRSIEAKYDDLKAIAKCRTQDFVSFKIRLFSGREDVEGGGIIVEVQRRKGSSHCFMKDCRAVLSAAEGGSADNVEDETMIYLKRPVSDMACLKGVQVSDDNTEQDIETPKRLLSDDNYDSHILGMESVEKLTNPLHAAPEVVVLAAKSVILPVTSPEIRDSISNLLKHGCLRPDEAVLTGPEGDNDFNEQMHHLALTSVLNAVRATAKDGTLADAVSQQSDWFSHVLIPALVEDIRNAPDRAHDARTAIECLKSLSRCSPLAKTMVVAAGALDALEQVECTDLNSALGGEV